MAASEALFQALAEALGKPSKAYRAAQAGLNIPEQALSGYVQGSDIADKLRQRDEGRRTLSEVLGENTPERVRPYGNLNIPTIEKLGGLKGLADITETRRAEHNDTLENILTENVRSGKMTMDQAAEIKRNMSPGSIVKPPPGYRYDNNGNLLPIPGGEPAHKLENEASSKESARQATLDNAKFVKSTIDTALTRVGPMTTGLLGSVSQRVPGSPAKNLQQTLQTVRANVGFDKLQEMRKNSPTGGALGQVSDNENKLLQSVAGSLVQEQSSDELVRNLNQLGKHYSNVILAIEGQTGDPEADDAIAKVISSTATENEKRARIQGIRGAAGR